jgi:DNA replication protein DnaC
VTRRADAGDRAPCPLGVCDGSGWILGPEDVARPCECRERIVARARLAGVASVIPAKYRGVSFDRPPVTQMSDAVVGQVREYTDQLGQNLDAGRGLWFFGDAGTGKTTLAMLVSRQALEAGRSVAIYSLPRLLSRIRRTYGAEPGEQSYVEFFTRLTSVDLLHIDDLGAEKQTEWVLEQLYSLINERYESQRSVVVTSNHDESDLQEQIGKRVVSRLTEICGDPIPMFGEDRRYSSAQHAAVARIGPIPDPGSVSDEGPGWTGPGLGSLDH